MKPKIDWFEPYDRINKSETPELDKIREYINHTLLKNGFLAQIGSGNKDTPVEKRGELLLKAMGNNSQAQARIHKLFDKWKLVKHALNCFFDFQVKNHGHVLTPAGEAVRHEILNLIRVVDGFINVFKTLAALDDGYKLRRIEQFFSALDQIGDKLSQMSGDRFYDYFQRSMTLRYK